MDKGAANMQTVRLPQPIQRFVEYRTGDVTFIVAPDYSIVYWDTRTEFLTGTRAEDILGKACNGVVLGQRESEETFSVAGAVR